jgi:NAD(P)H-dependent flavin oxidoreductase YrpB (nitropropane dioxygenase family)
LTRGVIGVNLMVASADYEDMVQTAVDEDIDIIISGAGLPLELPKFIGSKDIGLVPVVSSARTLKIICKRWLLRYNRLPDAVIVEGPQAGGHLGYGYDDLVNGTVPNLKDILMQVLEVVSSFDKAFPVIAAGGIFDGGDIARYLSLGASGVQMATRFVCTEECDAHPSFKQAYVGASREDLTIIKSPVGLPGRVIKSAFVEKINRGETMPFRCKFQCLRTCDPTTAPYCIAKVLANAVEGDLDNAFVFAGANAYKCKEIVTVKKLIEQLEEEYARAV